MKRTVLIFVSASIVLVLTLYFGIPDAALSAFSQHEVPSGQEKPSGDAVPVSIATVTAQPISAYIEGIGTVQAYNTIKIRSRVDGEITDVLFREGQDVQQNDPLMTIDRRPFEATLMQRQAAKVRDQARLASAVLDMNRYDALKVNDFASRQQVERQHALVDELTAQIADDTAQIRFAQQQLDYTTVRAPISGSIGLRQVDAGNFVRSGSDNVLAVIVQLRPISVIFTIAAKSLQASKLTIGLTSAPVTVLGQDNKTVLDQGVVETVDNQVDPTSGTIKLKGRFANNANKLWPGDFVNGRIVVGEIPQGLTVPPVAVRHGPLGDYVWLVNADDTVVPRPVVAGPVYSGRALIERGLAAGDRVVTEGYYRLDSGTHVAIQMPPQRPAASSPTPATPPPG